MEGKEVLNISYWLFPLGLILISMNGIGPIANVSGYVLLMVGVCLAGMKKVVNWGPWWMWVGFALILPIALWKNVGMVSVSMITLAPFVYLVAMNTNLDIMRRSFGMASIIVSASILLWFVAGFRQGTGGIVDTTNYNLSTGVIIAGALLAPKTWRWIALTIGAVGVSLAGAQEGLFALAVIGIYSLIRRDFSWKILPIVGVALALVISVFVFHQPHILYSRFAPQISSMGDASAITDGRWDIYTNAITHLNFLGHGYNPVTMAYTSIHDVPLMVAYQLGILGLIGWAIMVFGTLKVTSEKYLVVGFLALGLWDHFFWTQLWLWTPAILGVAIVSKESDRLWNVALSAANAKKGELN